MKAEMDIFKISDEEFDIVTGGRDIITVTGTENDLNCSIIPGMRENSITANDGNDYLSVVGPDSHLITPF